MPFRRVERPSKEVTSKDQKRRRQPSSESETEQDVQESRPKRKSARCVTYKESDSDFEDGLTQNSEVESDFDDMDDQAEEAIQKTIQKSGETRNGRDKNKKPRVFFTEKQREILNAAFHERHHPTEEQRKKIAEETNLSTRQVKKWFNNKRQENPEWVMKRVGLLAGDKKQRMEEVFALNRRPNKEMIASLVSELGITTEKVYGWFATKRYRNPVPEETPLLLCEEDARPILMEYFEKNPRFRDYKNPELKLKTGWPRYRLREFFETVRQEHGIVDTPLSYDQAEPILREILVKDPSFSDYQNFELKEKLHWSSRKIEDWFNRQRKLKKSPLPYDQAEPILMEILVKDPLFSDFKNVELKQKIQWPSRKIEEWFRHQRHSKKENQFRNSMEKFFETCQFLEKRNKTLELESGGAWRRISKWMKNKRKDVLESLLKKEITVNEMPDEMAIFERLYEKYDAPEHEDLILYIEKKEKVSGDRFAVYLVERWAAVRKLHPEDVLAEEEEEDSDGPLGKEYPDDTEFDFHENDTPLSGNAPIVNHIKNEIDDFEHETKNVPRFVPATVYRDQSQDVEEKHHI
ncbi:hypothetical protein B9Z55_007225 [Caenorhabditis nigoni]|uniref:Homeobox domain-containing protein n=1 Tax=Caenorhabditis nigoni TaxID=1611254 RepID=A0A2G5V8L5_9PELO|nr:hypothetical protein B9Z55_007225 [Caenorhabditis nigoni]